MSSETRRKAIEAYMSPGDEAGATETVDALSDLMREIAREESEADRKMLLKVVKDMYIRQPTPEAIEHGKRLVERLNVEAEKSAAPTPSIKDCEECRLLFGTYTRCKLHTPATDKCEACGQVGDDKDPHATWCKQHITWSATTPPSAKYRPICVTCGGHGGLAHSSRDDCLDCGRLASQCDPTVKPTPTTEADIRAKDKAEREAYLQRHLDRTQDSPAPSSEPTMETPSAKGPPETMPEWPGPPGYYPEYVWLSGQTAYSDAPPSGTARPKYIRADVAAKEVAEAKGDEAKVRSMFTETRHRIAERVGGTPADSWSTLEDAIRRVVAERDTARQEVSAVDMLRESAISDRKRERERAEKAEARVKELEAKHLNMRQVRLTLGPSSSMSPGTAIPGAIDVLGSDGRSHFYVPISVYVDALAAANREHQDLERQLADRAEARVKELERGFGFFDLAKERERSAKAEATLADVTASRAAIIQQRDDAERELTAANLAIESARKTLWTVKP